MANKNAETAKSILDLVGGKENVAQATHCMTRLRLNLVDSTKAQFEEIKKLKDRKVYLLRRKLGVVFQDFKLLPKLTVYENVAFAMEVLAYDKNTVHKRVMEVLKLVGLSNKVRQYPNQLSGSRFPVGSSQINSFGLFTIALAITTLCCSPPDS